MAKRLFKMRVTQVITNEFDIECDDATEDPGELAIEQFIQTKNLDIDTQAKDVTPRLLESQPEQDFDTQLVAHTHFDCWGPKGGGHDSPEDLWAWDSLEACSLVQKLAKEWNELQVELRIPEAKRFDFLQFANDLYLRIGQENYFKACADNFVMLGFSVYNSDDCFEVYKL